MVLLLEELLELARDGQLLSFAYMADVLGSNRPEFGVLGRWRGDKAKFVGELSLLRGSVGQAVLDERQGYGT